MPSKLIVRDILRQSFAASLTRFIVLEKQRRGASYIKVSSGGIVIIPGGSLWCRERMCLRLILIIVSRSCCYCYGTNPSHSFFVVSNLCLLVLYLGGAVALSIRSYCSLGDFSSFNFKWRGMPALFVDLKDSKVCVKQRSAQVMIH